MWRATHNVGGDVGWMVGSSKTHSPLAGRSAASVIRPDTQRTLSLMGEACPDLRYLHGICVRCICWNEFAKPTSLQTRPRVCRLDRVCKHVTHVCRHVVRVCKYVPKRRVCRYETTRLQTRRFRDTCLQTRLRIGFPFCKRDAFENTFNVFANTF